jgi:hypothetical protein
MYNFNEFDFKKMITKSKRDLHMWADKSQFEEEEKESDGMQIDSSSSPFNYQKNIYQ